MVLSQALSVLPPSFSVLLSPGELVPQWTTEACTLLSLSPLSLPPVPCLSSVIWCTVVYWLGFVVRRDNQSTVWTEEADEWWSLSRTKRPPLHFIDVLMRLSWLPSEFALYAVVGLQADRCTWTLSTEKDFYAFL